MSLTAQRFNPTTGEWDLVHAETLTENDRKYRFRCPSCGADATLVICNDKDNHFRSDTHRVDCPDAMGHKLIRVTSKTEIDIDAILTSEDRTPKANDGGEGTKETDPNDPPTQQDTDDDDPDQRYDPDATLTIRSASGMYRVLSEKQGHDYIDDVTAREVNSIFLRRETLQQFKDDWGAPIKLVVTKRCNPSKLKHRIPVSRGYVILRDAYSADDEDAIYFVVKMAHPDHDKAFKMRLFGRTELSETGEESKGIGKDRHRNIVIFANWRRVKHSRYRVYQADLNSRMVAYVNAADAD